MEGEAERGVHRNGRGFADGLRLPDCTTHLRPSAHTCAASWSSASWPASPQHPRFPPAEQRLGSRAPGP